MPKSLKSHDQEGPRFPENGVHRGLGDLRRRVNQDCDGKRYVSYCDPAWEDSRVQRQDRESATRFPRWRVRFLLRDMAHHNFKGSANLLLVKRRRVCPQLLLWCLKEVSHRYHLGGSLGLYFGGGGQLASMALS